MAHNLIKDAKYIRTEEPRHDKHFDEVFKVYERIYDDVLYEMKVKFTINGNYLYYIKRK